MRKCISKQKCVVGMTIILGIINAVLSAFTAIILQRVIDKSNIYKDKMGNYRVALFYILIETMVYFLLVVIVSYFYKYFVFKVTYKIAEQYRIDIFKGIIKQDYNLFYNQASANYISDLTNDINIVTQDYLLSIFEVVNNAFLFAFTIFLIFYYNRYIALAVMLCMILMLILPNLFNTVIERRKLKYSCELSSFTNEIKDVFGGYEILKSFNVLSIFIDKIIIKIHGLEKEHFKSDNILNIVSSVSYLLANITQITILFMGVYFIIYGNMTVGAVVALIQLSSTFISPIMVLIESFTSLKSAKPIVKKLDNLIEISDKQKKKKILKFKSQIEIENLIFQYNKSCTIINNINLTLERGKKYVIVGKNGCGKSTLLKLLSGYFDDYNGKIKFDNTELQEYDDESLKDNISIVHQNVYMFNASILENICLFKEYKENDIYKAIEISGLSSFIAELKDGVYTRVEENGSNFSGGQKQRIAVARAIVKRTPILILDEGVCSIDRETGIEIEKKLLNIKNLMLITVTHTLNADLLKRYDSVIYMESGKIVEVGSYEKLITDKKSFYDFINSIKGEDLENIKTE